MKHDERIMLDETCRLTIQSSMQDAIDHEPKSRSSPRPVKQVTGTVRQCETEQAEYSRTPKVDDGNLAFPGERAQASRIDIHQTKP